MAQDEDSTGTVELTSQLYVMLINEVKARLVDIERLVTAIESGDPRAPTTVFNIESAYLQLRLVCESVALASLAAHHSEAVSRSLEKEWNAHRIFVELENINPDCFPRAMRGERTGEKNLHFALVDPPAMDRADLMRIYHACDAALHRGSLRPLLNLQPNKRDETLLKEWLNELVGLLACHVITVPHLRKALVVQLWGNEKSEVTLAEAYADGDFVVT